MFEMLYSKALRWKKRKDSNPYKFGLIGSSDTHTAASSQEEDNFFSKIGLLDSSAALRGSIPETDPAILESGQPVIDLDGNKYMNSSAITWGASGLAGVWAEANTRDSIYDAFRRKESFATSGPRMTIRFFAGYDLDVVKLMIKIWLNIYIPMPKPWERIWMVLANKHQVFLFGL